MAAPELAEPEAIDFSRAGVVVRDDIFAAHRAAWQSLASPGVWWTSEERIAIAAEARTASSCALCREAKQALSPFSFSGRHDSERDLPAAAVEAVHRIVTDPSRLTRSWVEQLAADGLSDGHYVELVGVVVTLLSIDRLCQGVGAELHPLPGPVAGEPSRIRPDGLEDVGAFTPMLSTRAGKKLGLWNLPVAPNVIRALSLVPPEVEMLHTVAGAHYLPVEQVSQIGRAPGRALDRAQIELVAARVSSLNECFY